MKITVQIEKKNPVHITFGLFVNGGKSGTLVLRIDEWSQFMEILQPDKITDNT